MFFILSSQSDWKLLSLNFRAEKQRLNLSLSLLSLLNEAFFSSFLSFFTLDLSCCLPARCPDYHSDMLVLFFFHKHWHLEWRTGIFLAPVLQIWHFHKSWCICLHMCLQSVKTMAYIMIFLLMRTCVLHYIKYFSSQRKHERSLMDSLTFWEIYLFAFLLKVRWEDWFHTHIFRIHFHLAWEMPGLAGNSRAGPVQGKENLPTSKAS